MIYSGWIVASNQGWHLFGPGTKDACGKYCRRAVAEGADAADLHIEFWEENI